MKLGERELRLSNHAYERYCQRVAETEREELTELCSTAFQNRHYRCNKRLIQLNDVWWRYARQQGAVVLVTCYGESAYDLIDAIHWAKRHNDRINLMHNQ